MYEEEAALRVMAQAGTNVVRASSKLAEEVLARYLARRAVMTKEQQHQELLKNNPMEALVQRGIPVSMALVRNEEEATKLIARCKNANINLYIQKDKETVNNPESRVILVWDKNYDALIQTLSLEVGITPMTEEDEVEYIANNLKNREIKEEPKEPVVEAEKKKDTGERKEPILERKKEETVPIAPENFPLSLDEKEMTSRSEMTLKSSNERPQRTAPSVLETRILSFQEDSLISSILQDKQASEIPSPDLKGQAVPNDTTNIILMNPMEVVQNKKKGIYETMSDIHKEMASNNKINEPVEKIPSEVISIMQNLIEKNEEIGNR